MFLILCKYKQYTELFDVSGNRKKTYLAHYALVPKIFIPYFLFHMYIFGSVLIYDKYLEKMIIRKSSIILFVFFLFQTLSAQRQIEEQEWLNNIFYDQVIDDVFAISAKAEVKVSDGLRYATHSIYLDPQRAVFQLKYPDQTATQGIDGKYIWQHDGKEEKEAPPFFAEFILGHQFHAQLLFFHELHSELKPAMEGDFRGVPCKIVEGSDGSSNWKLYYQLEGLPLALELMREGESNIVMKLELWKKRDGFQFPWRIIIDDVGRTFEYNFSEILINKGELSELYLEDSLITDEQKLLRMHRIGMDDHLFERIDGLRSIRNDSFVVVNRGEVITMNGSEFDAGMSDIMQGKDHYKYDDLIRPIVRISDDGTLGWVIVQVRVEGVMLDENGKPAGPFEFESAWIELYEKVDGHWKMTGNVSNFKS